MQKLSPSAEAGVIDLDAVLPRAGLVRRDVVRQLLGIHITTEQRWQRANRLPSPRLNQWYDAAELRQVLTGTSSQAEVA